MSSINFPEPLKPNAKIAICAFSSEVEKHFQARLDIVLNGLILRGYQIVEGDSVRQNTCDQQRASELMNFLVDDSIAAIMPPWGGELALGILQYIDFNAVKAVKPKWLVGFSDVSTLACVLTSHCGWATLHSANLMQLHPNETESNCLNVFHVLALTQGDQFEQVPSDLYQSKDIDYVNNPDALFEFTEPTQWQCLNYNDTRKLEITGRLFGGCLDTLSSLLGSPYLNLLHFKQAYAPEGIVLYLENAELSPTAVARSLITLKLNGVFTGVNGIVLGRSAVINSPHKKIDYYQAIELALGKCIFPVLFDADIGHVAPNLNLINGATCTITAEINEGKVIKASLNTELC
jgi:muramoyltetrapeptide carboxypeptidase LdcA involved in peptidoglycan recycling